MRRPLRFLPCILGLAGLVYGAAHVTGGWLGVASRHRILPPTEPSPDGVQITEIVHDGGQLPGVILIALGIAVIVMCVRPRRPAPPAGPS